MLTAGLKDMVGITKICLTVFISKHYRVVINSIVCTKSLASNSQEPFVFCRTCIFDGIVATTVDVDGKGVRCNNEYEY